MRRNIVFNGKFMTAKMTGVHRVAYELISAVDRLIADSTDDAPAVFVAAPIGSDNAITLINIEPMQLGFFSGMAKNILWEQFSLPFLLRPSLLINLCNIGPGLSRNAISMIHDAQVFATPKSYSRGFRLWYRIILPIMGFRHRQIVTVSNFSKQELVRYGIAKADKIVVIHNGCDHVTRYQPDKTAIRRHGLEPEKFVLALSNAQHHKNISILLEAFANVQLEGVKLALFGMATKSDFLARGHAVPDNVVFLGPVSDEELAGLMSGALAFACPSLTEGFGLPPLEAMMLGCPAIVAPCGALPEVCGDAAIYADPGKSGEWAMAIMRLNSDPEFRAEISAAGKGQAEKFTWARSATQLLGVIEKLLARNAKYLRDM